MAGFSWPGGHFSRDKCCWPKESSSWRGKLVALLGQRFSQYNTCLLRRNTGGACLYMPQDGHCLASFEVIPPPPPPKKASFFAPKKWHILKGDAAPTLEKTSQKQVFLLFFWHLLSEILSRWSRLSRTTSDPAQKSGKFQAKIAFFLFFRRKSWHDFVTPFSTFANIKGSLPTNSTTPDRLRPWIRTDGEGFPVFGQFCFRTSPQKSF